MAKPRIKWRIKGFREARRLPKVGDQLDKSASQIASACGGEGDGFVAEVGSGKTRDRAAVIAASPQARKRNARDNTLVRNLTQGKI